MFIAKSADIVGNVALGNDTSVWYQAVLRGDEAPITVGDRSNIQDGTVVHVAHGYHTVIGSGVTIGHNCTIHGCTIEDDVLVGMGTTVLNGAKIGRNTIIGAGSLVTQNKEIPEGSLVLGSPAKVVRALTEEEIQSILNNAQEYVDLMDEEPGRSFYETAEGHIIIRN
ncbi:MAG: gamma carbonic anhydrase family protein [Eubacterium aggregans]|uniref:gamma carbonic anhydrase family protein n=1 Tax=Eubacterium aggregans TaxID=81409 RepID=UPI001FA70111|nr:gamma carbonic anhydrase family protein [Eubacterium aggregans]MDD4692375.1 gamma carbonic anhydrase family protein [Eubacterium aggregans]MEA5074139.1 gamma carbonic anhydrase family protein [Eubacterium aggregans]